MTSEQTVSSPIRIREIEPTDLDAVVELLLSGFNDRSEQYWRQGLDRLANRAALPAYPRFGYALTVADRIVGVVLLIVSRDDKGNIRANVSSWYVEPDYRFYSAMLIKPALRLPDVTLVNISPAPHTLPTITAQGFRPYTGGIMACVPALGLPRWGAKLRSIAPASGQDATILETHAAMGCLSFRVDEGEESTPFIFALRDRKRHGIGVAQLIYCQDLTTFKRHAGMIGRRLLRLGFPIVIFDAERYQPGLIGYFFRGRKPKYVRGPACPRLGDLSETELVYFGP